MTNPNRSLLRLACDGGTPVRVEPFPSWPAFDDEMIEAAAAVLKSGKVNYWTGDETRAFEREFAEFVGARHAVAVANGTVALELALKALEIGPGDEVVVPSRTFVASASCAVTQGARPVFADVDPVSQNITADTVQAVLSPRTRAVIAVHLAGRPCDMDPLMDLAAQRGIAVIEDCAQAHGATYRGRSVGSIGHAAAFSFCQDKIITTGGEGGMLTTNDDALWRRAWSYKDHGKSWDAVHRRSTGEVFRWLHEDIGTNLRMTEMQAAIGRVMLRRLTQLVEIRRSNAERLARHVLAIPSLRTPLPGDDHRHSYYRFYTFLRSELLKPGWTRDRVVLALQAEGIPCGSGVCGEVYREQAFQKAGLAPAASLAAASELGQSSLMFHVHPLLTPADMDDTGRAIDKVLTAACESAANTAHRAA